MGLKLPEDVRHFNYFAQEGEFSSAFNDEGFLVTDLGFHANGDSPRKLYMDSPFFVAGSQISPSTLDNNELQ